MRTVMAAAAVVLLAAPAAGAPLGAARLAATGGLTLVQAAPAGPAPSAGTITPQIEADVRGQRTIFAKPLRPVAPVRPQPPRGPVKLFVGPIEPQGAQGPAGLP